MAATKKTTKKTVTKRVKKADDNIYWVVLERKLVTWKAYALFKTKERADQVRENLEFLSNKSFSSYKVERVQLAD